MVYPLSNGGTDLSRFVAALGVHLLPHDLVLVSENTHIR